MDITKTYLKKRSDFGRQALFNEVSVALIDSIEPNPLYQKSYILRNPIHVGVQVSAKFSQTEINTTKVLFKNSGMNHLEGGWPKEINVHDEEAVLRYRRRIERDDAYISAVVSKYNEFYTRIRQNNAIEMYEMYFREMPKAKPVEKYNVFNKNLFIDPYGFRPVSCIAWTVQDDSKLVVCYCDRTSWGNPVNLHLECLVWDIETSSKTELLPPSACWQVDGSPSNPSILIGGLEDGRVCIFDMREASKPVAISPLHLAHRDPVSALVFMNYRLNTEFFSGSTDGQCLWWDIRDLTSETDRLVMSTIQLPGETTGSMMHAQPVSTLQYERSFPTRFLCGTDTGLVFNINRKGKSMSDIMSSVHNAHWGPVKAVHRSPLITKMFITCGDWRVQIWSEELPSSPIISGTTQSYAINDVCWAPHRISCYMTVSSDGRLRMWDLLRKYNNPLTTHRLTDNPLLKVKVHATGNTVAVGDSKGYVHLVGLSENLIISGDQDKHLMLQNYDRELYRERILETRLKEIRMKTKAVDEEEGHEIVAEESDEDNLKMAEIAYKKAVTEELVKMGLPKHRAKHV